MNIELLLNKFYEGISTPEEELSLMNYFLREENVDERWKEEQQLFRLLQDTQIHVPADVSKRLDESIRQLDVPRPSIPLRRKLYYWIGSAAAVVLLCIGLFFTTREPTPPQRADTFSNPEEAAWVAQQTLVYMSTQLNKGLNKVTDAGQELDKVNQIVNKHLYSK